jgi:predicted nucleic acid-binding protein
METKNNQAIITDTSGIVSLVVDTDTNHTVAVDAAKQHTGEGRTLIVPEEIFAEALNLLGKKFSRALALDTGQLLLEEPLFLVGTTDSGTRALALALFRATPIGVSFTDCLVMATADTYKTPDIFGFDGIFSKKGYNVPRRLKEAA